MTAFSPGASPPPVDIAMRIYEADDLARLRVPAQGRLRKQRRAVDGHFEHAARGADHFDLDTGECLLQLSRQTGGSELVVSDDAVFDANMHGGVLSCGK